MEYTMKEYDDILVVTLRGVTTTANRYTYRIHGLMKEIYGSRLGTIANPTTRRQLTTEGLVLRYALRG